MFSPVSFWLIRARLGETEAADQELSAYLEKRRAATPGDWISNVGGFLVGKVTEANLFAAAASTDEKKERGQLCEAWFYAGMKKLLAGDKGSSADYFRKCLATGAQIYDEYDLAEAELKALKL
jgi:lipoprotein NlpI